MSEWGPWKLQQEHDLGGDNRVSVEHRRLETKDDFATVQFRVVRHWKPEGEQVVHVATPDAQEVYEANCRILDHLLAEEMAEAMRQVPGFGRFA